MKENDLAVSAECVFKSFRDLRHAGWNEKIVFSNFSFDLEAGRVLGILGPSGCGKTSLLRLCAGLDKPDRGSILVFGKSPLPQTRAGRISVLSSENTLLPWRSAIDNVGLPLDLLGVDKTTRYSRCGKLLEAIRIDHTNWTRRPHELSEGQRQRLRLAQALVTGPDLLLLDEPFSNVDEGLRRVLISIVLEHLRGSQQRSAILVTHHAYEVAAMANTVFILAGEPATNLFPLPLQVPSSDRTRDYLDNIVDRLTHKMLELAENDSHRSSEA